MTAAAAPPATAVGHLDADCFYVSAERVRDDFLRDKPVGVLGNQGACVIAKSYEMKAAGVKTGEPIWEALPKCPTGIYVKRDFRWYEVLRRMMLEVVRELSPRVEYYSIDEFFFLAVPRLPWWRRDVDPGKTRPTSAAELAKARSRCAGDRAKPGVVEIDPKRRNPPSRLHTGCPCASDARPGPLVVDPARRHATTGPSCCDLAPECRHPRDADHRSGR